MNRNYALIFAGGTGKRFCSKSLPKQFLSVHGKPIIIHTLLNFENCKAIDGIVVVCYEPFIKKLDKLLKQYGIKKVLRVLPGGATGQQSIYIGLQGLSDYAGGDDIVLIHDGVRPLIDEDLINRNIECVKTNGNAITASQAIETVILADGVNVQAIEDRSHCYYAKAPQSFRFGDIYSAHQKAVAENKGDFIDSATMMKYYGHKLYMVLGSPDNMKITTQPDYFLFKGLLDAKELSQMKVKL